jgi:cytidine deaminase
MLNEKRRDELIAAAIEARKGSYSPYSQYAVGAALFTEDDELYSGSNIENAVYPLSLCAERVAAFKAISEGARKIQAIAVVTRDGGTPCGACRQVLSEFGLEAEVFIANDNGELIDSTTVSQLLPKSFGPSNLESD